LNLSTIFISNTVTVILQGEEREREMKRIRTSREVGVLFVGKKL